MNKLKCSVTTCRHNANDLCELRKITGGRPRRVWKAARPAAALMQSARSSFRKLLRMLVFTETPQLMCIASAEHCTYNDNR